MAKIEGTESGTAGVYRAKPLQVRAVQWNGRNVGEIMDLGESAVTITEPSREGQEWDITVETNNGPAQLLRDHWLIVGEYDTYPCDPYTFQARWERTEEVDYVVADE